MTEQTATGQATTGEAATAQAATAPTAEGQAAPEKVRLVIWDLDETFWKGTLTEGGIERDERAVQTVITLAERGIISSICSKNDLEPVRDILTQWGVWQYFVFPSVNWEPKGPRIAAIVEAMALRPPTILFVDDNPMNLREALHFVPGLQVSDEKIVPGMLDNPLFKGKDDKALTRLDQYKLLEKRHADQVKAGDQVYDFLRSSGITVEIDPDVEKHLDRAIELVNRTNQLNFVKARLPEDIEQARAELRAHLQNFYVQAGLVRVRDKYGDYGYVGFFVQHRGAAFQDLAHYCFSCRTLGMYVETWLYRRLGRPKIEINGEVLTDIHDESVPCDWITLYDPARAGAAEAGARIAGMFIAGGCDLEAVAHYVGLHTDDLHLRLNTNRGGSEIRRDHSQLFRAALEGVTAEAKAALLGLGYAEEDIARPPEAALAAPVWLLSFWADAYYPLYRHRETGIVVPFAPAAFGHTNLFEAEADIAAATLAPEAEAALAYFRAHFEHAGLIDEATFKANVRAILAHAPAAGRVLLLRMSEQPYPGYEHLVALHVQHNRWLDDLVAEFPTVTAIQMDEFLSTPGDVTGPTHYERLVYQRLAERVIGQSLALAKGQAGSEAEGPPHVSEAAA